MAPLRTLALAMVTLAGPLIAGPVRRSSNPVPRGLDTSAATAHQIIVIFNTETGESVGVTTLAAGDGVQVLLPTGIAIVSVAPTATEMTAHMVRWTATNTRATNRVELRVRIDRGTSKRAVVTNGTDLQQVVLAPLSSVMALRPDSPSTDGTLAVDPARITSEQSAPPQPGHAGRPDDWRMLVAHEFPTEPPAAPSPGGARPDGSTPSMRDPAPVMAALLPPQLPQPGRQADRPSEGMTVADLFAQPNAPAPARPQERGPDDGNAVRGSAIPIPARPMRGAGQALLPVDGRRQSFIDLADRAFESKSTGVPPVPEPSDPGPGDGPLASPDPVPLDRATTAMPAAR